MSTEPNMGGPKEFAVPIAISGIWSAPGVPTTSSDSPNLGRCKEALHCLVISHSVFTKITPPNKSGLLINSPGPAPRPIWLT